MSRGPARRTAQRMAIIVTLALVVALGVAWSQFGKSKYSGCVPPDMLHVDSVDVTGSRVRLTGYVLSTSAPSYFDGYEYGVDGGVLTLGIHYSGRKPSPSSHGGFDVTVPTGGRGITKVILTDGRSSRELQ